MNHQTADHKANASVFLFFSTAHLLKIILPIARMTHLVLPKHKLTFRKTKNHFLPMNH